MRHFLKGRKVVIVNVDNDSRDGTKRAFLDTKTTTEKKYISTPRGVKGKGNNILNLFCFVKEHQDTVKGILIFDADLKSISPQ